MKIKFPWSLIVSIHPDKVTISSKWLIFKNCNISPNNSGGIDEFNNPLAIEMVLINKKFLKKNNYTKKVDIKYKLNNPYKKEIKIKFKK